MENENCLKKYLYKMGLNLSKFSTLSRVPVSTLHRIANGKNSPCKANARRIVRASKNNLTMEDFGFRESARPRIPQSWIQSHSADDPYPLERPQGD